MRDEQRERGPSGWPKGSIGDLSAQVGEDVRDLIRDGFTWDEIHEVAAGTVTLDELLKRGPRGSGEPGVR